MKALKCCIPIVFFTGLLSIVAQTSFATHLKAGEISIAPVDCNTNTFLVTMRVYLNSSSPIVFGEGSLDFGDETPGLKVPQMEGILVDGYNNVKMVLYEVEHQFARTGTFTVTYTESNRNGGVLNINNSVSTPFILETRLLVDSGLCNSTPRLTAPPIDFACTSAAFFHNPAAFDQEGDSLTYEMAVPKKAIKDNADGYQPPNSEAFYTPYGIAYSQANESGTGSPAFYITGNGTLVWDSPGAQGEYVVAIKITEWRKVGGTWLKMGHVVRDMQIVVQICDPNNRPVLTLPEDLCVEAGTKVEFEALGIDPDSHRVMIEAFAGALQLAESAATIQGDSLWQKTSYPVDSARALFSWQTTCGHIRKQHYLITFKIRDLSPFNKILSTTFKTLRITVIPPVPQWKNVVLDFQNKVTLLDWDLMTCAADAAALEVWRRTGYGEEWTMDCGAVPSYAGFIKKGVLNTDEIHFEDRDLDPGARYCYRLTYQYPLPGGEVLAVSRDTCIGPVVADAPVMTHVTVDSTHQDAGMINVAWTRPFDLDPLYFGRKYRYAVYRSYGFEANGLRHITDTYDTVFVDKSLNTLDSIYSYQVILYSEDASSVSPQFPIDTSAVASQVRLEIPAGKTPVPLAWQVKTPWSNTLPAQPWHSIFRREEGAWPVDPTDSVNVIINEKFAYTDSTFLIKGREYCYRILTRGGYGNVQIKEPLLNYSQWACIIIPDTIPPPAPTIISEQQDCAAWLAKTDCEVSVFSNELRWTAVSNEPREVPYMEYRVYYSRDGQAFELIASVHDTFYVHSGLPEIKGCYRVTAVDGSGNESLPGLPYCFENCPAYYLPNVITPGLEDGCNDVFSAYGQSSGDCGQNETGLCSRFVKSVKFSVFNRWGKIVYQYSSGIDGNIYIDWDGRDQQGKFLSSGVYYYQADVTFSAAPHKTGQQVYKGTVMVM